MNQHSESSDDDFEREYRALIKSLCGIGSSIYHNNSIAATDDDDTLYSEKEDRERRKLAEINHTYLQKQGEAVKDERLRRAFPMEWANAPDGLLRLIGQQFYGVDHYWNQWLSRGRIHEIIQAFLKQKNIPINESSLLARQALAAYLEPLYEEFKKSLHPEIGRPRVENDFLNNKWTSLHRYLVEKGFDAANVRYFIEQEKRVPYHERFWPTTVRLDELERRNLSATMEPQAKSFRVNHPVLSDVIAQHREQRWA